MTNFDSWSMEMQFTPGTWTDVTEDVILTQSDIVRVEYGMPDNGPTDRVARTGNMTFSLNNSDTNSAGLAGLYSPGHANCRSGFATGIPVRIRFSFENITRTKFYGRIAKDGIVPDSGTMGNRRTKINVVDWLNQAATHKLYLPAYTTNKRIDEIVPLIVAAMPLAPLSTDYDTGVDIFTSVFDTIGDKTTALSEFQKLALSEWGFIYIKRDSDNDEILAVEGRNARTSQSTELDEFPLPANESGYLLWENDTIIPGYGGYLLQENGDKIILNVGTEASYADNASDARISYGKHMANYLSVTSYPRTFDTSATVLYSLPSAMAIGAGSTRTFTGYFSDPNNLAVSVAGKNMVAPIATTDYLFNSDAAGTGTNLTANLTVTCTYGAEAGSYSITNNGTANGYLTLLQARGLGIYTYNPVTYISQDTASQAVHGLQTLEISMEYQDDPTTAETVGAFENLNLRDPRLELDQWTFWANACPYNVMSFLAIEIGDRAHFKETQTGFDRDRYIDGVKFEVYPGGIVKATWLTRFVSSITGWYLGITGSTELGATTILG